MNTTIGLVTMGLGLAFWFFHRPLAIISQSGNKRLGVKFDLRSYEIGFKVAAIFFVVLGILFIIGVLSLKR